MLAATYARFSSDRQRESSIADQQRNCERRLAAEGLTLYRHFTDEGISGSTADRPGYQALLSSADAGEYQVLLVDDLSRLSRDQVESERIIRRLEFRGVRIIGVCDGYDSQSRARKLHRGAKNLVNELFLDDLRDKTHRGLTGLALQQLSAGGLAYGYRSVVLEGGHGRELHPEQAGIVREIFRRAAAGFSLRRIAGDLNARAVPSPGARWKGRRDGLWRVSALHAMLKNEIYVGRYTWNISRWERDPDTRVRKRIERPKSEWISHDMPELRIVDELTWSRVHTRMRERAELFKPGRGGRSSYLLSGLLRCGVCGGAYVIGAHRPVRYGCSTHRHAGAIGCSNGIMVRQDLAEQRILEPVHRDLLSDDAVELALQEMRRLQREWHQATTNVADIDREIEALLRLQGEGTLSAGVVGGGIERLQAQRRARQMPVDGLFGAAEDYRSAVADMRAVLTGDDIQAAREAIRATVGTIRLVPEDGQLFAEVGLRWLPLAGTGPAVNWNGSGGRIWSELRLRVA